jgi:hypothetical protein
MIGETMAGPPDLFVVCKNCGSEVSPYITECPYCGQRLRKRAPKIERDEDGSSRPRIRKPPRPTLGRLRTNEIPGIRGDDLQRPYVTIALVLLGAIGYLVLSFLDRGGPGDRRAARDGLVAGADRPVRLRRRLVPAPALLTIGIFGVLLERRHGSVLVALLWLLCASGGAAVAALAADFPVVLGGNGGALGLLAAWAVPVVLGRRRHGDDDDDADLLGVLVLGVLVAALPLATPEADAVAGTVGGLLGLLVGLILSRVRPR